MPNPVGRVIFVRYAAWALTALLAGWTCAGKGGCAGEGTGGGVLAGEVAVASASVKANAEPVSANDRRFWAFQSVSRPAAPGVRSTARVRSPIDAFLLARLEEQGLTFSADADRPTLARRVWLDLAGIPPATDEVASFVADEADDAYERLVDRALASPRFGERWGRHWLDVAGYVDTVGFDVDPDNIITSEGKWLYRDYVISAFNQDIPYDRFLTEQLAGDELADWRTAPTFTPEIRRLLAATGYLRTAADFTHEDVGNIPQNHFAVLHDTLEIVGTSVLGLTLNCARCHDHKFDPIPQEDYYRLMALFTPAYNPGDWKIVFPYDPKIEQRGLPDVSPVERQAIELHNEEIDRQIAELDRRAEELRRPVRERLFTEKLATLPEAIRADSRQAIELPADKRNEIQKFLASRFDATLKVTPESIQQAFAEEDRQAIAELQRQIDQLKPQRKRYARIQALCDTGPPPVTRRLIRGDHLTPGNEVSPGFLRVLCDDHTSPLASAAPPYSGTSGRRLALAQWLTARGSRAAGVTSRVMVNRVWKQLFGVGLVATPENFGAQGESPAHPALLEWLSADFQDHGWSVKHLIRQIVTSTAYRQTASPSVAVSSPALVADPDNRLLWRMRLKRLESEVIRDSVLAVCGTLDSTPGGPPIMLEARPDGMVVIAEKHLPTPTARWRRSVYLIARRAFPLSELAVFDQPVVATSCPDRGRSAVPLQSLTMLNGAFLWEQAERLAESVEKLSGSHLDAQVAHLFGLVLGRGATADEAASCRRLLESQSLAYRGEQPTVEAANHKGLVHLCHTLLNTSEFLYAP
ncbi:MAG: DUF1553 domain-containing protein [Planctomycetales bacterium]